MTGFAVSSACQCARQLVSKVRAIIRTGSSIIDKGDLRLIRGHLVVQLKQGPDLALFTQPGVLFCRGLGLTEVLRDRISSVNINRSLPWILACLDEQERTYLVIGSNESIDGTLGRVTEKVLTAAPPANSD